MSDPVLVFQVYTYLVTTLLLKGNYLMGTAINKLIFTQTDNYSINTTLTWTAGCKQLKWIPPPTPRPTVVPGCTRSLATDHSM